MLLGGLSGLLLILAFPPFGLPMMAIPALVPLAYALRSTKRRSVATMIGMAWAGAFFGIELHWMPSVLAPEIALNWLAYSGVVGCLILLGGVLGAATWSLAAAKVAPALAFAIAFTGVEWIRAHLGPLAFPWLGLGTAFSPTPGLMAPIVWVGERGLAFTAAGSSGLLATALGWTVRAGADLPQPPRGRGDRWLLGVLAAWGAFCLATHLMAPRSARETPETEVAVVTTAFGPVGHVAVEDRLLWLEGVLGRWRTSDTSPVEVVLIPEGTLPLPLAQRPDIVARLAALSDRVGAPLVVGAYGAESGTLYNSTFLVGPDGLRARSDKRHKVAIVESGFASGSPVVLAGGGALLGPLICFESLFADVGRDLVRAGATILVNPTSESWFRQGGAWAAAQHGDHLRGRALETGRWVVRVANEGESLAFDPTGRVRWRSDGTGVARTAVRSESSKTVYVRLGDVAGLFSGLSILFLLLTGALSTTLNKSVERASPPTIFRPE